MNNDDDVGSAAHRLVKGIRVRQHGPPNGMKATRLLTIVVALLGCGLSSNAVCAFQPAVHHAAAAVVGRPRQGRGWESVKVAPSPGLTAFTRRTADDCPVEPLKMSGTVGRAITSFVLVGTLFVGTILVGCTPMPASAGLLDEFGADGSQIKDKSASTEVVKKGENAIDPTLRASYYYPTAKKRYLPRIQRVSKEILSVPDRLASGDWDAVQSFAATADNAILPLQLYVSSLDGQGLSMKNQYAIQMKRDAQDFEKSYNTLQSAIQRHDPDQALTAIVNMGLAVADYRQQGRLSDDDGYIPSIDDMRRMAMRRPTVKVAVVP